MAEEGVKGGQKVVRKEHVSEIIKSADREILIILKLKVKPR